MPSDYNHYVTSYNLIIVYRLIVVIILVLNVLNLLSNVFSKENDIEVLAYYKIRGVEIKICKGLCPLLLNSN